MRLTAKYRYAFHEGDKLFVGIINLVSEGILAFENCLCTVFVKVKDNWVFENVLSRRN